ncbi:MAG TPA: MBL fold metallo-hydrolase [Actinomycetes bacterium]|nr:MBL fold metallo-hydrolase [Actinomycetes bacterium]
MSDPARWLEVGDGVLVRRYAELDLSIGLVLGSTGCLVIDTRGDEIQGAELAAAVRQVTALPWVIVVTHAHFDHCFGTAALQPSPVWAHAYCVRALTADSGERHRHDWVLRYRERGRPEVADALESARLVLPEPLDGDRVELSVGGRPLVLTHLGRGHTDHDLLVQVPDSDVLFTGDLVENGAPPAIGDDAFPLEWPDTLTAALDLLGDGTAVPGHGDPVNREFVAGQRDELAALAALCEQVRDGELDPTEAVRKSPYPPDTTRDALACLGLALPGPEPLAEPGPEPLAEPGRSQPELDQTASD